MHVNQEPDCDDEADLKPPATAKNLPLTSSKWKKDYNLCDFWSHPLAITSHPETAVKLSTQELQAQQILISHNTHTVIHTHRPTDFNFLLGYEKICVNNAWWDRGRNHESRSKQPCGRADWQFDRICANGELDGERWEEEEDMEVWTAATVCSSDTSRLPTSSKQAFSLPQAFQRDLCMCQVFACCTQSVGVRLWCVRLERTAFLIRVHFPPKSN